ncbi:MAG: DUF362 domain-containing protein [Candidatus Eisenbacteria bacterium]|nr:DUF362 domain-containing protein [Candidatus Eisenbacteria bacterium]
MNRSVVAVLKTKPETVVDDFGKLLDLAHYRDFVSTEAQVCLKINISWHHYFPGCSTSPWQLEGVIKKLVSDGYDTKKLIPVHNSTVVVDPHPGQVNNKLEPILRKYGLEPIFLNEPAVQWVRYEPKEPMLALDKVFPDGIYIPEPLIGQSIIHLPTMKTHVFTTMTGAMKNAFGGLLQERRHWTHGVIHETLVDLLVIQKEIHKGVFAVMDGTVAGDGPGPRAMRPHVKNYILASGDSVAIDAVAAKMMGFDPLSLKFIRLAHEKGLGCGDVSKIEIVGEDVSGVNFHFKANEETFASRGQKMIYHGPLKPFEKCLLRSPIVPWSFLASRLYHDVYWYPCVGKKRVAEFMKTEWGKLFERY